jgi:two-component system, sensor histidine kinase
MIRFRDLSINKKLFCILGVMAILLATELVVLTYSVSILSAVRAYVGGEGLWSKAQKNAAYYLLKYSYTHHDKDYANFKEFLTVPISDHQARLALLSDPVNYSQAQESLLKGRLHQNDIAGVIWLFTTFQQNHYLNKAIQIWIKGDVLLEEFEKVGEQLHEIITKGNASQNEISALLLKLDHLNDQLTMVEDEFSYTLGEASRWLEGVILITIIISTITVGLIGLILTIITGLQLSRNIKTMNLATRRIAEGDFSGRVPVCSKDETGQLADALNSMIDELEKNINQRQHVENILVDKNIALKTSDLAKDEFMAHISHELRTPLNGIVTMTQVLMSSELTQEQREQLVILNESNEQLLSVINQVLDFSKIESGNIVVENIKFNIKEMLNKIIAPYSVKSSAKGIKISYVIDQDVPAHMTSDLVKVRQILTNILDNAVKFTEQGSILLHVSVNALNKDEENIIFEIVDSGIGISPAGLARIFKPFSQADSSMTRKYGGTGLGLIISKKLAEIMNGSITVDSSEKGSRFTVMLPNASHENAKPDLTDYQQQISSNMAGHSPKGHVLLVEDNTLNQRTLAILLHKLGYTFEIASNGVEALNVMLNSTFDLVLMDCQMPNMNGIQATIEIRKREGSTGEYTPIIGLTAHALDRNQLKCIQCGMDGYMAKPYNIDELSHLIHKLIVNKRFKS